MQEGQGPQQLQRRGGRAACPAPAANSQPVALSCYGHQDRAAALVSLPGGFFNSFPASAMLYSTYGNTNRRKISRSGTSSPSNRKRQRPSRRVPATSAG